MGRNADLLPRYDKKKDRWLIAIPARLSETGKYRREYYKTEAEARERSETLLKVLEGKRARLLKVVDQGLMIEAMEAADIAGALGFESLTQALQAMAPSHEAKSKAPTYKELLQAYQDDNSPGWSERTIKTRWSAFVNRTAELGAISIAKMDTDFWRKWLSDWREKNQPADVSYNDHLKQIKRIFSHSKATEIFEKNPLTDIPTLRIKLNPACVSQPDEVEALFKWLHANDQKMIPYFVLGYFGGLRPTSEIAHMTYEKINFADGLIDVNTTKTANKPRRQVPLEKNAALWLAPYSRLKGPIYFQRRAFENARIGASKALYGTDEDKNPIQEILWGKDIMRHSYGSYLEAKTRGTAGSLELLLNNMGHTNRRTYDAHYHNFRTKKEAASYWSISPPNGKKIIRIA